MTVFLIIALLFVLGATFTAGLVMPKKTMIITSEVIIDRPQEVVWDYVRMLRHQEHYNTWIRQDPNIRMAYHGTDGTVGFIAAWESKTRMGSGEQEILSIDEGWSYESELRFRNHDNTTHIKTNVEPVDGSKTKVTTVMSATPSFPMNLMIPMMMKAMKKDMDESSAMLKKVLSV